MLPFPAFSRSSHIPSVAAALAVSGRLLVNNPIAQLMPGGVGVLALVAVAAAGTGERGIAHLFTGGGGHFALVVMPQRIFQHSPALDTGLGRGTGGGFAGGVAFGGVALQAVIGLPQTQQLKVS